MQRLQSSAGLAANGKTTAWKAFATRERLENLFFNVSENEGTIAKIAKIQTCGAYAASESFGNASYECCTARKVHCRCDRKFMAPVSVVKVDQSSIFGSVRWRLKQRKIAKSWFLSAQVPQGARIGSQRMQSSTWLAVDAKAAGSPAFAIRERLKNLFLRYKRKRG